PRQRLAAAKHAKAASPIASKWNESPPSSPTLQTDMPANEIAAESMSAVHADMTRFRACEVLAAKAR
ncbi:MAG: hypothetical protein IJP66_04395, partial [Kiritimatiellae bacterium]|nr:hypothetical protein [Kiritimatiellia bacterium]